MKLCFRNTVKFLQEPASRAENGVMMGVIAFCPVLVLVAVAALDALTR